MPRAPTVSFVMPVRDGATHVTEAVRSVLGQTIDDLELVVVDDGSTDQTPELLAALAREDPRVRVVAGEPPGGAAAARNRGAAVARAEFIAVLDADDVALPERLGAQLPLLESDPSLVAVGGAGIFIDAGGRELGRAQYPSDPQAVASTLVRGGSPLIHSAVTMRAAELRRVGGYRTALAIAYDYDLWLRLAAVGAIANVAEPVVRYRLHPGQSSGAVRRLALEVEVAKAAARRRAAGEPDPLEGVTAVDDRLAAELGVAAESVTAQQLDYALWLARTLARGAAAEERERTWTLALDAAEATADPAAARRRVLDARASAEGGGPSRLQRLAAAARRRASAR